MRFHRLPALLIFFVVLAGLAGAGCDDFHNPPLPSFTAPTPGNVTISGLVLGGATGPSASSTGATVQAAGTPASTTIDNNQAFTLTNVPTNSRDAIVLVFNGAGLDTRVSIGVVNFADHIVLVFARSADGTLVLTRTDRRPGDGTDLTGRIDSISFQNRSFIVLGQTIRTDPSTQFIRGDGSAGTFFDLFVGLGVHAESAVIPNGFGAVLAKTVRLENRDGGTPVVITGAVASVTGNALDFSFVVNGVIVRGGSSTTFDNNRTFDAVRAGVTVEVTGIPRTGFLQATRIRFP